MASGVIRILNHETHETHERDGGTRKRPPVVFSTSMYAPNILPDRYRILVDRPSFPRSVLIF